jgi:O-antigen ligase
MFSGGHMDNRIARAIGIFAALLIGMTPVWMVLAPLDITSHPVGWQVFVRMHSFIVPFVQLVVVVTVMAIGFSPFGSIRTLPRITKIGLFIWAAIATTVSFQPDKDHLSASIGLMKLAIAGLVLLALIDLRSLFRTRLLLTIWIAVGFGMIFYVVLWTLHIAMLSPQGDEWVIRIPGVNNVRHTGYFAFAGFTAGLMCLITFQRSPITAFRWGLPLLFGSVSVGLSLWTGSRGPLLASVTTAFMVFCIARPLRRRVVGFFLGSAVAALVVVSALPVPHEIYGISGATGAADISAETEHDASSGRKELWANTVGKIVQRPFFGWGLHQFAELGPSAPGRFFHPHNLPLQMLFSGGVASVVLTFFIFFPALKTWQWPYRRGIGAAAVSCLVGMLAYSMYDGALFFSYPIMIFLLAIATSIKPPVMRSARDTSHSPAPIK